MSNLRSFVVNQDGLYPGEIRVVTYNLLANTYAMGWHGYCPRQYLSWQYRMPRILSELQHYSADVVCLQEVEASFYEHDLWPAMDQQGYAGMHQSRRVPEIVNSPEEGIALFYKKDTFDELARKGIIYCNHAFGPPSIQQELQLRNDGALMVLLRHKQSHQPLLACCTHLYFDPHYPDIKALQAAILCSQVSAFLQCQVQQGAIPTTDVRLIIAGDFNSLWRKYRSDSWDKIPDGAFLTSGVYRLLATGQLNPSHPDHPSKRHTAREAQLQWQEQLQLQQLELGTAGLQLSSMHMMAQGCEPPLTTKTTHFAGCLDYIWLSPQHFKVSSTLALPYPAGAVEPQEVSFPAIPNQQWPSDHLAMGCDVQLVRAA